MLLKPGVFSKVYLWVCTRYVYLSVLYRATHTLLRLIDPYKMHMYACIRLPTIALPAHARLFVQQRDNDYNLNGLATGYRGEATGVLGVARHPKKVRLAPQTNSC